MTAQPSRILPSSRNAGRVLVAAAAVATTALLGPKIITTVDFALFAVQPLVLQLHILAALGTVALGGLIFSMRKGRAFHRTAGWIWVVLMATTAVSSLFIVGINGDFWSLIHLLSGWVLVVLPLGVWAARKHRVDVHRRTMTGIFVGGSLVAGAFTFLPGRLMWRLVFG
ncbi:MAG: DUF2306 domain-containing protein [Caulobacter sp.]|nr:DUF2306 domain-containing protein [Caulobacter sp.]